MLKHLLGPKRNLHVMHWLDKLRANITLNHVGADASVLSILIDGSSNYLQNFPNWWSENLRKKLTRGMARPESNCR